MVCESTAILLAAAVKPRQRWKKKKEFYKPAEVGGSAPDPPDWGINWPVDSGGIQFPIIIFFPREAASSGRPGPATACERLAGVQHREEKEKRCKSINK